MRKDIEDPGGRRGTVENLGLKQEAHGGKKKVKKKKEKDVMPKTWGKIYEGARGKRKNMPWPPRKKDGVAKRKRRLAKKLIRVGKAQKAQKRGGLGKKKKSHPKGEKSGGHYTKGEWAAATATPPEERVDWQ